MDFTLCSVGLRFALYDVAGMQFRQIILFFHMVANILTINDNDYMQFLYDRIYFPASYLNNRKYQRIYN